GFSKSYSAHPWLYQSDDIADLYLPTLGRVECRPIAVQDVAVAIPPETWCDRLGYVVVQISDDLSTGTLMGFLPTATATMVLLKQLQPIDEIFTAIALQEESVWHKLQGWAQKSLDKGWRIKPSPPSTLELSATRGDQTLDELYEIIENSPSMSARP
ncbi:MAG: DUF1822 family protein, partial [Synechococcaceae cyanobacterium RL_1_2]|nr:DUF1822 family protein [Synechococcaceae cyanobacterium RL_1_2]